MDDLGFSVEIDEFGLSRAVFHNGSSCPISIGNYLQYKILEKLEEINIQQLELQSLLHRFLQDIEYSVRK